MNNTEKIIKIALVILFMIVLLILVYKLSSVLVVEFNMFAPTAKNNVFTNYSVDMSSPTDGTYYVKFKNLIGSTNNVDSTKTAYYKIDLTVATGSEELANQLMMNRAYAAEIIRESMQQFRREDIDSSAGKEYAKKAIKQKLAKTYNTTSVDDVYFEHFTINSRP